MCIVSSDRQPDSHPRESTKFWALLVIRSHISPIVMEIKKLRRDEKFALKVAVLELEALLLLLTSSALHMKDKHAGADDVRAIKRTGPTI